MTRLALHDSAPDFEAVARERGADRRLHLADFRGQKQVVLYFYPRDFTRVCTAEACAFRDSYEELVSDDTEVIGVSADDAASHDRFAREHRIPFPLIPDTKRELIRQYGASSVLMSLLGMSGRITYVIDKSGKIAGIFDSALWARDHLSGAQETIARLRARTKAG